MDKDDIVNIGELADITKSGSLSISKEAVFNIEGNFTITGSLSISKTIVINILPGGSLTVNGATSIAKDANLTINGGGVPMVSLPLRELLQLTKMLQQLSMVS